MQNDDINPQELKDLIEICNETAESMRIRLEPFQNIQESMLKATQTLPESLKENIRSHHENWLRLAESIRSSSNLAPMVQRLLEIQNAVVSLHPAILEAQKAFEELPLKTRETLLLLAQHGWYFDGAFELPKMWELRRLLSVGDITRAEQLLIMHFKERLTDIEAFLCAKFPFRSHLIHSAFSAHRRGEYILSIPVLLAQADGICQETIHKPLFQKDRRTNQAATAVFVQQVTTNALMSALLSPLEDRLSIAKSSFERKATSTELNRHMVLHGEALDYGNETNGCKAISLLNYIGYIFPVEGQTSPCGDPTHDERK